LLSVPVLAGSAAFAIATLVGAIANVLKVSPIKALVWSAVAASVGFLVSLI